MTPAEELHQAAFYLRNPLRCPIGPVILEEDLTDALVELLHTSAEYANTCDTPTLPTHVQRALIVARTLNTRK